jgi:hypothetical protein
MRRFCFAFAAAALIFAQHVSALNLQDFAQCIGPQGQGHLCQLDARTYQISTQLQIGRSNITIKGTILTSASDTVLQRAPGFQGELLQDIASTNGAPVLHSVTIRDLTVDGNRDQNTYAYTSYRPEVNFFSTASVLVTNCDFINSPFISLAFYGGGTSGVVINNSYFANPVVFGVWSDTTAFAGNFTYLNCATAHFINNFVVANSQFKDANEGAILAEGTNFQILGNTFTNNHSYPVSFNDDGGQIDLTECMDNAAIVGNSFQNASAASTGHFVTGVELHGTNLTLVNNTITNNSADGIDIQGGANVFISNWNQATGTIGNQMKGITFAQLTADSSLRPVDFITVDRANVINNGDWALWSTTTGVPINHLTITNSCLANNSEGVSSLSGLGTDVLIQNNSVSGCGPK